eukprot:Partr_v1_DN28383_c2_g1_i2_m78400 putative crinkler (CRN) family protein
MEYYDKYSRPTNPLRVTLAKFINTPFPDSSDIWNATGDFRILAKKLQVSNRLYHRRCFEPIKNAILQYIQTRLEDRISVPGLACSVFLTGTPGIGKTAFLLYLIDSLRGKHPIIFGSKLRLNEFQFWDSDGNHTILTEVDRKYLDDERVWFIMDSRSFDSTLGPCLICSSPRDSIDSQFRKTACPFYMPVWSWDEIYNCYHAVYRQVAKESEVRARYFVLGGVPRYMFDQRVELAADLIKNALENTTLEVLSKMSKADVVNDQHEASHRIIHRFDTKGDFRHYESRFASNFVATKVAQRYATERRQSIIQFLDETSNMGFTGTLRGNIFEPVAHRCVIRDMSIKGKELLPDGTSNPLTLNLRNRIVKFVTCRSQEFERNEMFKTDESSYFQPQSKTFECLDSWVVIDGETWGFQFTVGKSHRISSAIYWYHHYLNVKHYVTVVYDQHKFDQFKYCTITPSKKEPFKNFERRPEFAVKQYLIKLDLAGDILGELNPTEGYESFVGPNVDDDALRELGLIDHDDYNEDE